MRGISTDKPNRDLIARLIDFSEESRPRPKSAKRLLSELLCAGTAAAVSDARYEIDRWSSSDIQRFGKGMRTFLRRLVASGQPDDKGTLIEEVPISVKVGAVAGPRQAHLTVDGPAIDVLWFQFLDVLRLIDVRSV